MNATPALWNLAGAYLHQDWAVEYDTWQEAVDAFVRESSDLAPQLPRELDSALDELDSDEALHQFFRDQGGAYRLRPEDGDYRQWLTKVARRVEAATGEQRG